MPLSTSDTITIEEPPCEPVTDACFGWTPPKPLVGQEVDSVSRWTVVQRDTES